jgi:CubicO group peptidase (beta-lactamase class C family)
MSRIVDFETLAAPEEVGFSPSGIANVQTVLENWCRQEPRSVSQLVVLRRGLKVIDRSLGDLNGQAINAQTRLLTFSCSKAFTAACIYRLVDAGLVEWDAPVAEYWPQFAQGGKANATIRHVLTHHAGLPNRGLYRSIPLWPFWSLITAYTARSKVQYPPGDHFAYHIVTFGWILGEVIRRVSGRGIEDYFREEFSEPLGMRNTTFKITRKEMKTIPTLLSGCPDQDYLVFMYNRDFIRQAVVPAGGAHSTAQDLALFYQMLLNGGEYSGRRFIEKKTLDYVLQVHYDGEDHGIGRSVRYGLGLHLGGQKMDLNNDPTPTMGERSTERTFGHAGTRSCFAWADPGEELVFAYTTNHLISWQDHKQRWKDIADAVWDALV